LFVVALLLLAIAGFLLPVALLLLTVPRLLV
jgi:hypothetical protein